MAAITALSMIAKQFGVNRVVTGIKIPHPCGDPHAPPEVDKGLRRAVVTAALSLLQRDVEGPTVLRPNIIHRSG